MVRWALLTAILGGLWLPASAQDIATLGDFVREPDSVVKEVFGPPDEVVYVESKEATIWSYALSDSERPWSGTRDKAPALDSLPSSIAAFSLRPLEEKQVGAGYRQFAFWNGKVAAVSLLRTGAEAGSLYEAGLSYLQKNAHWVGQAGGFEHARLTRMGDNLWTVAKQSAGKSPEAVLRVGDAGYLQCDKARQSELRRVKAEFGADPR
jgi:hypothetical protein